MVYDFDFITKEVLEVNVSYKLCFTHEVSQSRGVKPPWIRLTMMYVPLVLYPKLLSISGQFSTSQVGEL